jgi:hypothetical protein
MQKAGRYVKVYLDTKQTMAMEVMVALRSSRGQNDSMSSVLKEAFDKLADAEGIYYKKSFGMGETRMVHTFEQMLEGVTPEVPEREVAKEIRRERMGRRRRRMAR